MTNRVDIIRNGGVVEVQLARPDKLNALDRPMFDALIEAGKALIKDKSVRAVVLSGQGRSFCAGLDFSIFSSLSNAKPDTGTSREGADAAAEAKAKAAESGASMLSRTADSDANLVQRAGYVWQEVPVPVIAAVHGVAYGGGLQIALGADIRHVHPEARLSVREMQWGIIPDMSGTQTLRHLVGLDVAKELTFTARVVPGTEAKELGLATKLSEDPRQSALAIAADIAQKSPDAIRAAKQLLNQSVHGSSAQGLMLEEKVQLSLLGRPNQMEAVMAGLEKRTPNFQDPQ